VKAHAFEYLRATTLEQALAHLAARPGEARILAGGQSLVPVMNMRLAAPAALVDVNRIGSLATVERVGEVLRIGALTRHCDLVTSPAVAQHAPLLARAAPCIGHEAIRNRGTLGGSLAHADPGAELPACALALDATVRLASTRGTRTVAADDFFLGPYTTALEPDEMIVALDVPAGRPGARCAFHELARRAGDYAMAGLAATARREGAVLRGVRLAFFGVGGRPVLARAAAAEVEGRAPTPEVVLAAQRALPVDVEPQPDLHSSAAMKAHLVRVLTERVLAALAA
jgi:carbon-monoxide dehydrogenase medium subunit